MKFSGVKGKRNYQEKHERNSENFVYLGNISSVKMLAMLLNVDFKFGSTKTIVCFMYQTLLNVNLLSLHNSPIIWYYYSDFSKTRSQSPQEEKPELKTLGSDFRV